MEYIMIMVYVMNIISIVSIGLNENLSQSSSFKMNLVLFFTVISMSVLMDKLDYDIKLKLAVRLISFCLVIMSYIYDVKGYK